MVSKEKIKVMTHNLYLGADIFRVVEAAQNSGPENSLAIPMAVTEVFKSLQYANFVERAEAIADEIQKNMSHLIGLQEVSTILKGEEYPAFSREIPAKGVVYEYINILMDVLAKRKLDYKIAATSTNADLELPMLTGITTEPGGVTPIPLFCNVRVVDHDVILVREKVETGNILAWNFSNNAEVTINNQSFEFTQGFVAIDAIINGKAYYFVNIHLMVGGDPGSDAAFLQASQMQELLQVLRSDNRHLPTILLGDFNSSPEDSPSYSETYNLSIVPPYMQAEKMGYIDVWKRQYKWQDAGYACCFNHTVDDPDAELYERIDHIFLLPRGKLIENIRARVIGDDEFGMTPNGLWASHHTGVVGRIKFQRE